MKRNLFLLPLLIAILSISCASPYRNFTFTVGTVSELYQTEPIFLNSVKIGYVKEAHHDPIALKLMGQ